MIFDLDPTRFTLRTMPRRFELKGYMWSGIFNDAVDVQMVLDSF